MSCSSSPSDAVSSQARAWVVRLASGEVLEAELQAFDQWLRQDDSHRQAFERERGMWQAMAQAETQVRAMLQTPPKQVRQVKSVGRRRVGLGLGMAAALLLTVMLPGQSWRWRADHHAGHAIEQLALSDGSVAVLDAGAAIRVSYDEGHRTVELLHGRAWFQVKHGDPRPFLVEAGDGVTRDIGTAFEVEVLRDGVRTAVSEGRVEVSAAGTAVQLQAGQVAGYLHGGDVIRAADTPVAAIAAWREGDIVVERMAPADAIAEIARYHRGRVVVLGALDAGPVSGVFRAEGAAAGIQSVAAMAGARVQALPGGWLLVRPEK